MSKIRLTPNASGTGTVTLTVPSTSTDRTVTLPDNTGTILTTESTTTFKTPIVNLAGSNDTSSSSSFTLKKITTWVTSGSKYIDPDNIYDSTNHRIVPTVAGYYWASMMSAVSTTDRTLGVILFSGASDNYFGNQNWDQGNTMNYAPDTYTAIGYCDGVDDYIEFYSRCNSASRSVESLNAQCYLIRST